MAVFLAHRIIGGYMTFAQVPARLKEQVRQILIEEECEHLITE